MSYLGISTDQLTLRGAIHTAQEISQQPVLWEKIGKQAANEKAIIQSFLEGANFKRIILTGAGTSSYIGMSLRGAFQRNLGVVTEAIPTTDLVSHPHDYFLPGVPTLMISFARSGNSPESVAAVELADMICTNCYHLIITCNAHGKLAQYQTLRGKYVFVLPPEANDESLAMTSSYTGMMLAGKLVAHSASLETALASVAIITKYAGKALSFYADTIQQIANMNFKRAVFLGAGPFYGTATEGHLKLQELTDGKIISKNDSFLGFRHGPKAVVDETTLVVYLFSNNQYSFQYEKDLVESMKKGKRPLVEIGISESALDTLSLDHVFMFSKNGCQIDEEFMAICSIVPAQMLGFYKSLQLGLKPDTPSATGAITRVVEGVQIYSHLTTIRSLL